MKESDLMRLIQVHATKLGARLFRNNTGRLQTQDGRWVAYGLCVGSSDLIGYTRTGQFLAIEVKTATGRITPEQLSFLSAVMAAGGRAGVARSIEDLEGIING